MAFAKEDVQMKFERNATELLRFLITTAGKVLILKVMQFSLFYQIQLCFLSY